MSTNQPTSNPKDLPNGQQNGPSTLLPTSPISPVAPFPPIREPAKRSRAPEFYGFVAWTSTSLLYILYLLWGFLPDAWIAWLGVEWYPSREWAILLPAYSIVLVLLTYFSYFALAFSGTASFSDINAIQDTSPHIPTLRDGSKNPFLERSQDPDSFEECYDVPLGLVNRMLYSERPSDE
ncbi:PIG-P-domain-containing protein [Pterulicium gracile]|uniref:PIG-P-domain-containing protein n=1 Tax=Pterulicium gracile TaxID=1884261 RepID=A0A5C3R268_9AGAR|nr:PIG-P-domain-containing protein [Pterula gracilis]